MDTMYPALLEAVAAHRAAKYGDRFVDATVDRQLYEAAGLIEPFDHDENMRESTRLLAEAKEARRA